MTDGPIEGAPPELRLLQVVALLSIDGSYGGPTAVAVEQCTALSRQGVRPTLLAGWDGRASLAASYPIEGRRARKLVRRSFASLVSPGVMAWFWRSRGAFDVVHVHLARDLTTLPVAVLALVFRLPLVVQTHGMVTRDDRWTVRLLDRLVVRRVLARAAVVVALTVGERKELVSLGAAPENVVVTGNAVSIPEFRANPRGSGPLVLFVSRMAERKRPVTFVEMAARIRGERDDVRFHMWGADEGQLAAVEAAIQEHGLTEHCHYRGAAPRGDVQEIMASGQVLVVPSVAEPLGMVILEALSVGLPTVVTSDTGLSDDLKAWHAAAVTDGSVDAMAAGVLHLINDENAWREMSDKARSVATARFDPAALVASLADRYRAAASRRGFGSGPESATARRWGSSGSRDGAS